jgi:polyphosphate kinase
VQDMLRLGRAHPGGVRESAASDVEAVVTPGDGRMPVSDLLRAYEDALLELEALKRDRRRVARKLRAEAELRPWRVELLKLQRHLEIHRMRMIVLFEGHDGAGKGGTIRRVTRYMNEKHYRVVALGKPTEDQRSEWYFQRYAAQLPAGGETVLLDRSWYNRAMVEPVFGFCTAD